MSLAPIAQRAALALALLAAAAGSAAAQEPGEEPELNQYGKPVRPVGYKPPANRPANPTTGPFAGRYEYCFGGVGPQCGGAPGAPNTWSASNNGYMMFVSVGSILHDNCCLRNPAGKWCGGTGVDGRNPAGEGNHNGTCVREWDKAWFNTLQARQWRVPVNPTTVADLTPAAGRRSVLREGTVYAPEEVNASRQYAAPAGTSLDVGDEAFCASGRAGPVQRAITGMTTWVVCQ